MAIVQNKHTIERLDADGILTGTEVTTDTVNIHKSDEGDFIKLYTEALDKLPADLTLAGFRLLLQLAKYASYADINDLEGGMLIQITATIREEIQQTLDIQKRAFYKYLKNLVDCNLLREVRQSCYQLNPSVVGKGYYEYKPSYKQGGINDLRIFWSGGCKQRIVVVDDNRMVASQIKNEINEIKKEMYKAKKVKDYKKLQDLQLDMIKFMNALKEISENEYTKYVEYLNIANDKNDNKTDDSDKTDSDEDTSPKGYIPSGDSNAFDEADPFNMFDDEE